MGDHRTKLKPQKIITLLTMSLVILTLASTISAQGTYYFSVGAKGDDSSNVNVGVRAEIRTHSYFGPVYVAANGETLSGDNFAVAEPFSDGSVIYFGYLVYRDHTAWFWQRLSSAGLVEDEGSGFVDSVGSNGTWHSYSIVYDSLGTFVQRTWDLILDGNQVGLTQQLMDESKTSSSSVYVLAEKITETQSNTVLGPVEFRDLAYLKSDGWHNVTSLKAKVSCNINTNVFNNQCNVDFPYGVLVLGPNHIAVGSGLPRHANGDLLWTTNPIDYLTPYLTPIGIIVFMIVLAYFSVRRIPIANTYWKHGVG